MLVYDAPIQKVDEENTYEDLFIYGYSYFFFL